MARKKNVDISQNIQVLQVCSKGKTFWTAVSYSLPACGKRIIGGLGLWNTLKFYLNNSTIGAFSCLRCIFALSSPARLFVGRSPIGTLVSFGTERLLLKDWKILKSAVCCSVQNLSVKRISNTGVKKKVLY